jgi:deazaflavin-dependent oxidoreductase (nitroreductase family)
VSGQWRRVAVAVLDHDGQQYLVSAYGNTEWVRNLRAAGSARLTRRGREEHVRVAEVPLDERPPILKRYLEQFGAFPTVGRTFAALPDPADHPAFRITGADYAAGTHIHIPSST